MSILALEWDCNRLCEKINVTLQVFVCEMNTSCFNRLVEDSQRLRGGVYWANGIPKNIVKRFADYLTRTSPHLKSSVRKIAEETITHANRLFEQGPIVGDEFVDYLE